MSNFCPDQGRTSVYGPREAGQEGVHAVRRNRKPAEKAEQGKKGYLWMDTSYHRPSVTD